MEDPAVFDIAQGAVIVTKLMPHAGIISQSWTVELLNDIV